MRKTLTILFIMVFALANSGMLHSQENQEDGKFQKLLTEYLDAMWKFYPTAATMAGYHKYDNKLEDLSQRNLEKRHDELDEFNQKLVADVDRLKMSPDGQIDHQIVIEYLDIDLVRHESLVPWAYNPQYYNEILKNCISGVLNSTAGSAEDRAKNAADRLKDLPKLLKQARENLQAPPQIYTEAAIQQFGAILAYYTDELPQQIAQAPDSQKSKLQENLAKALPELQNFQSYLQNDLLAKSTGNFRLAAAHNRMLRVKWQNDIPMQQLLNQANADIENIRREMTLICTPYYKIMEPRFDINNPPGNLTPDQLMNEIVNHIREHFKTDHITRDEFLPTIQSKAAEIQAYLQANDIVDLPSVDVDVREMASRDYPWVQFMRPNPYGTGGSYGVEVGLLAPDVDEASATAILEACNDYMLPFFVMREVYPGQFVPCYIAGQNTSSLVRKLYPNLPLIKGWALFVEDTAVLSGFGNYNLLLRLNQLKMRMKAAIDFILDLNIHQASMTEEQAMGFMLRKGFYNEAEAEYTWNRIRLIPGDSTYAYVGFQELLGMETAYKEKMGDSYSQKDFLAKVLSFGHLPLRHLKIKIME
jgi:uncharacterized protein (DUF885 family)